MFCFQIIIAGNFEHKNYILTALPAVHNFIYVKRESLPFGRLLTKFLGYDWALQVKDYLFCCSDFHVLGII